MARSETTKKRQFEALQASFTHQLPERVSSVLSSWKEVQSDPQNADARNVFVRLVHSLSGSAGTFGFLRLGTTAREAEILAKHLDETVTSQVLTEIDALLQQLNALVSEGPDGQNPTHVQHRHRASSNDERFHTLIHILEDDALLAEHLATQLAHYGYNAKIFGCSGDFDNLPDEKPAARIVDVVLPEGDLEGPRITAELKARTGQNIPTIFISVRSDWQARLKAVRAGGSAYLAKPVEIMELVQQLDEVTGRSREEPYRILIVDNDELLARHHADVLRARGMKTTRVSDPTVILDVLPEFRPDLVLMDLYMPQCTGVECAQVIRQQSIYDNLPIVYLSSETVLERQLEAMIVGVDDFLKKPIADDHLAIAITIRARRFRGLNALMNRDGLTGLLNNVTFKQSLVRELSASLRRNSQLCLAMIDLDQFKQINDEHGHVVGDWVLKSLARLLKERGRQSDILGRYGGEEFAIVFPDTAPEDALNCMEEIRKSFERLFHTTTHETFNTTFSAGIACSPPFEDPLLLLNAADKALYSAKSRGRNCVVMHDSKED